MLVYSPEFARIPLVIRLPSRTILRDGRRYGVLRFAMTTNAGAFAITGNLLEQRPFSHHPAAGILASGTSSTRIFLTSKASQWRIDADFGRLPSSVGFSLGIGAMIRLDEYVKVAEAARILGVAQNTLRAWAEAGRMPMHRNPANGYRLFRRNDLEEFLERAGTPVASRRKK
jgi:excisionase family DNA binding protein